jgi:hypothetical protein
LATVESTDIVYESAAAAAAAAAAAVLQVMIYMAVD